MQTLARVNRTFRGKDSGLLVAYAPVAENLKAALAEYTVRDQDQRPVGRDAGEAATLALDLHAQVAALLEPSGWRGAMRRAAEADLRRSPSARRGWLQVVHRTVNWLRDPHTPGNNVGEDEETLATRFRRLAAGLGRAWGIAGRAEELAAIEPDARFVEEVRVWMAKFDAQDRQASGQPVPEEVQRLLAQLTATAVAADEVVDVYAAAGLPTPRIDQLDGDFLAKAREADNPHLAIEALRKLVAEEATRVSRGNLVRSQQFSERLATVMNRYTNSNLTSAEVIAELVAMAKDVVAEAARGERFDPPLGQDELATYDALAANESATEILGDETLAKIAREVVAVVRRDATTDWTVRDDVRAKLRSSVKRLLIKYKYPPDRQPEAIRLVIEQMEALAPRDAA